MRIPLKGVPDFHAVSDEQLAAMQNLAQQMVFTYAEFPEKKAVMQAVIKDIFDERISRNVSLAIKSSSSSLKPARKIKKSPVKKI